MKKIYGQNRQSLSRDTFRFPETDAGEESSRPPQSAAEGRLAALAQLFLSAEKDVRNDKNGFEIGINYAHFH